MRGHNVSKRRDANGHGLCSRVLSMYTLNRDVRCYLEFERTSSSFSVTKRSLTDIGTETATSLSCWKGTYKR